MSTKFIGKIVLKFGLDQKVRVIKESSEYFKSEGRIDKLKKGDNDRDIRYVVDMGDDILVGFKESELEAVK